MSQFGTLLELRMMVAITTGATKYTKLQSSTNQLFTGQLLFLSPTNSVREVKGESISSMDLLTQVHLGSSILVLTTKGSWIVREDCQPLISPPMAVPLNIKKLKYIKSIKYTIMVAYNAKKNIKS